MGARQTKRRKQPEKQEPPRRTLEQMKTEEVKIAKYQNQYSFEERLSDSQECKVKHPDCIPLIIERATSFKEVIELQSPKFLFHAKSQTAQAMVRAQKEIQGKQLWFYVHMPNNQLKLIYPQSQLGVLYQRYSRSDGNLYIFYSDKNLIQTTSTFMTVVQIICGILLILYLYIYFFGLEDILSLFGYTLYQEVNPQQSGQTNIQAEQPIHSEIEL